MKRQFPQDSNGMQMFAGGGGGAGHTNPMNGSNKRFRGPNDAGEAYQDALAAGKFELRMLIPSRSAGAVIGRGGEYIKTMRSKVRDLDIWVNKNI